MRGFDKKEYKERVNKALKLMEKSNLEMLLITSPQNFRYFTGSHSVSGSFEITGTAIISGSLIVSSSNTSSVILDNLPTSQPTITGSIWLSGSSAAHPSSSYLMIFNP